MLLPKKVKHRKQQRGMLRGRATQKVNLDFGTVGLRAIEGSWLTGRQIEAARRAMTRFIQRGGKIWIRIFPDKSVTFKGLEVGMGGGKGADGSEHLGDYLHDSLVAGPSRCGQIPVLQH